MKFLFIIMSVMGLVSCTKSDDQTRKEIEHIAKIDGSIKEI